MSRIIVLGSGLTGLTTALLIARDGHDVTVLERDPAPPPHAAIGALLASPAELFADPAVRERVLPWVNKPWLTPGPSRAELLDVLTA